MESIRDALQVRMFSKHLTSITVITSITCYNKYYCYLDDVVFQ